jgi:penicillin G amidase
VRRSARSIIRGVARLGKLLLVALIALILAVVAVWFGGRWWLSGSVATYEGDVSVRGLDAPVEISFDARGVPRVRAKTDADLFFAIGWLHASERLFQMELVRRLAGGELAEVFGEDAYETDVRQRRLGFARQARRDAGSLGPRGRSALESYVDGVNSWIATASPLPPEFVILRVQPRDWTVEDCLTIALYQTWFSHELMAKDEAYETLLEEVGEWIGETLEAPYPWSPPTVEGPLGSDPFPLRASQASNSWAISPARSASGRAIHAADPHLAVNRAPGLWYLASLHSAEGLDAVGVMQPGLPLVVMGHNGRVSWAFTVASVDIIDTFEEEIRDGAPPMVRTSDGEVEVESVVEEIRIKGGTDPRRLTVESTPNGPIVERGRDRAVSLRWAGFDFPVGGMVEAGLELMSATGFDEFRSAVTRFGALDANWIYSDRDGNVGYQLGVPIPIRDYDSTFAKQEGKSPASAWRGYVPLDETPHALNPPSGWVASCNNQLVGQDWPMPLPGFYDPYRMARAAELLDRRDVWSPDAVSEMQLDLVSGRAARWKGLAGDSAEDAGLPEVAASLRAWNGEMSPDSTDAAIFALWWETAGRLLFEDELGDDWKSARAIQEHVLSGSASQLVDDRRTPEVETLADVTSRAMKVAAARARGRTYGEISTLRVGHPLARVKLLDKWLKLSRGPVPMGGDLGSLAANFNRFDEASGTFAAAVGPSMRFVLDWADVDSFSIAIALGQSGNPLSPHYDDFFVPSLEGQQWILPFSEERQRANETSRLRLVP